MMRKNRCTTMLTLLTASVLLPTTVTALAFQFEGDVGVHVADFGDLESGAGLSGKVDILPQLRLRGHFTNLGQLDRLNFGAGYILPMEGMELEVGYYYEFWDFDGAFEDDAYAGYGRFAYDVVDELQLFGRLEYASFKNFDDGVVIFGLGAEYGINDAVCRGFPDEVLQQRRPHRRNLSPAGREVPLLMLQVRPIGGTMAPPINRIAGRSSALR